jgi:hypothetical protein
VGKTTLLTMLYREAVGGRLADLRLAAADARTADYLSDKILQLEAGRILPGTLAETELRFHLYHQGSRLELLVKDYQGEHVALGREEPIREFLRDCDALWLCVDAAVLPSPPERLRRQQEIEQLLEDCLSGQPHQAMDRPVALVLTKSDLLGPEPVAQGPGPWAEQVGMVRHALEVHCRQRELFAVSSLGPPASIQESLPSRFGLLPSGLAEPLAWLASALQAQDEARLERLWSLAAGDVHLLERGVACFAHRYPEANATSV